MVRRSIPEREGLLRAMRPVVAGLALILVLVASTRGAKKEPSPDPAPYVPSSDADVLLNLRFSPSDPRAKEIKDLRAQLERDPRSLETALRLARLNIEVGRERSDPRYNSWAEAALRPWLSGSDPPPEVLLMRATLRQSSHDFEGALSDLDQVLAASPDEGQAWLTRAVVLTVRGELDRARESCRPLRRLARELMVVSCTAGVDALDGRARAAQASLRAALERASEVSTAERVWAVGLLAEIAARLGETEEAESLFKQALDLGGSDAYLLGAYADLLLDAGRPGSVLLLLGEQTDADALLLRRVIAERAAGVAEFTAHRALLLARFEASRQRGDTVHRREQARFLLEVEDEPARSLPLAVANFDVQREPADLRILLAAALRARDPKAAAPGLELLERTHLEDAAIQKLAGALRALPVGGG
jgi:tetratricopeptide (TPR) repeat protein